MQHNTIKKIKETHLKLIELSKEGILGVTLQDIHVDVMLFKEAHKDEILTAVRHEYNDINYIHLSFIDENSIKWTTLI